MVVIKANTKCDEKEATLVDRATDAKGGYDPGGGQDKATQV